MRSIRWVSAAAIKDNKIYCVSGGTNILYSINLRDGSVNRHAVLDNKKSSYWSVVIWADNLYCIPTYGGMVYEFNIKNSCITRKIGYDDNKEIIEIKEHKDKIWLVPKKITKDVRVFNLVEGAFDVVSFNTTDNINLASDITIQRWYYVDDYAYLVTVEGEILQMDFQQRVIEKLKLPNGTKCRDFIFWKGMYFYLSSEDMNCVYSWDKKDGQNKKICESQSKVYKLLPSKDKIYVDMEDGLGAIEDNNVLRIQIPYVHSNSKADYLKIISLPEHEVILPWGADSFIFSTMNSEWSFKKVIPPIEDVLRSKDMWVEAELSLEEFIYGIVG